MAIFLTKPLDMLNALMIFKDNKWQIDTVGDDFTSPRGNFARFEDCMNALTETDVTGESAAPFDGILAVLLAEAEEPEPQTVTIEWKDASATSSGGFPSTPEISVRVTTSDGEATEEEITVSLVFGGTASDSELGGDYTISPPPNIPADTADGALVNLSPISIQGSDNSTTVCEITIGDTENYEVGAQAQHNHTIEGGGLD